MLMCMPVWINPKYKRPFQPWKGMHHMKLSYFWQIMLKAGPIKPSCFSNLTNWELYRNIPTFLFIFISSISFQ